MSLPLPTSKAVGRLAPMSTTVGQLYPLHHIVRLANPWLSGLQTKEAMQVYVHRGTGYWGPPFRVGAPGEIARIVLSPAISC